jgi:hypothetical protein
LTVEVSHAELTYEPAKDISRVPRKYGAESNSPKKV